MFEAGGKSSYLHLGVSLLGQPRQLQPNVVVLVHHLGAQGGTFSLQAKQNKVNKQTTVFCVDDLLFFRKVQALFISIVLLQFVVLLFFLMNSILIDNGEEVEKTERR